MVGNFYLLGLALVLKFWRREILFSFSNDSNYPGNYQQILLTLPLDYFKIDSLLFEATAKCVRVHPWPLKSVVLL